MFDADVFVIGGGPAGLAAAIAARRAGLSVVVADGSRPPIDKACGEGLMPDSLVAAAKIGIEIPRELGHPFRGIRFHGEGRTVESDFPNGAGVGLRRLALHRVLVETAADAGVQLLWETPVTRLDQVRARWVVGADGTASRVRKWAGLDRYVRNSTRFAFRRHYAIAPWSGYVEIYWAEGCQVYVTPVAPAEICVALISRQPELRLDEALARFFPELNELLRGAPHASVERGAATATTRLRTVVRGNVALIGDASGSVDAITGEGLCLTFKQAALLADAMAARDLSAYARNHPRLAMRPSLMGEMMLLMDRMPLVRRRALGAMAGRPRIFRDLLAMHVGALSAGRFVATNVELGLRMLMAG